MSTGYKSSINDSIRTYDSGGFVFTKTNTTGTWQNFYCNGLGYSESVDGYYGDSERRRTSGDYYGRNADGSYFRKGSIVPFTYYTITANDDSNGKLFIDNNQNTHSIKLDENKTCKVTISPKTGYAITSINGVAKDPALTTSQNITVTASSDQTFSATFARYYSLGYSLSGGTASGYAAKSPCFANVAYSIPQQTPVRAGYKFEGFSTGGSSGNVQYQPGGTYSLSDIPTGYYVHTVTLSAVWSQCTLSFDSNGGSAVASQSYYGTMTITSSVPTKAGYVFDGWLIDGKKYSPGQTYELTSNKTAVAQWLTAGCSIVFNANGGSGSMSPQPATYGVATTLSSVAFSKPGYSFDGWAKSSGGSAVYSNGASVTISRSDATNDVLTLFAKWVAKTYTLTINPNGGTYGGSSGSTTKQVVYDGSQNNNIGTATRDHYTFSGWYAGGTMVFGAGGRYVAGSFWSVNGTWQNDGGLTVSANWSPVTYTVTFNANGGSGGTTVSGTYGSSLTAPSVSRSGYTFAGWSPSVPSTITGNATYTAQWNANSYTVTFDPNGGTVDTTSKSYRYGSSYSDMPTPTRLGDSTVTWSFAGWWTDAVGGTQITSSTSVTASNRTFYAHWSDTPLHSVATSSSIVPADEANGQSALQANNPSVSASPSSAIQAGASVSLSAQTDGLTGIAFAYWKVTYGQALNPVLSDDDTVDPNASFYMPNADVTAIAFYSLSECDISVHLHPDNSAAGMSSTVVHAYRHGTQNSATGAKYGDTVDFVADPVSGYSFDGWYDDNNNLQSNSATYERIVEGDVSLYARYGTGVVVVAYENGGTGTVAAYLDGVAQDVSASISVAAGASLRLVATVESGVFAGWYRGSTLISTDSDTTITVYGAATYTAHFAGSTPVFFVSVHDIQEYGISGTIGESSLVGQTVETISSQEWNDAGFATVEGAKYYKVTGASQCRLQSVRSPESDSLVFKSVEVSFPTEISGGSIIGAGEQDAPPDIVYDKDLMIDENRAFVVVWGNYSSVTVTASAGEGGTASPASQTVEFGENAVVAATPSVGFLFAGWYDGANMRVSTSPRYVFQPVADTSLYARFVQEGEQEDAIFEWEGGEANMEMEWKSGTFTFPRPFDPVCARIDAAEYPVSLKVATMSAPDSAVEREHQVEIYRQSARRLPRLRPERFMRVEIDSSNEVDSVLVASSMAEAN